GNWNPFVSSLSFLLSSAIRYFLPPFTWFFDVSFLFPNWIFFSLLQATSISSAACNDCCSNCNPSAQSVPVQSGKTPPLLQYIGTLLTRGKHNAFESLELSKLVVNQNKKNLLGNLLEDDKLECSEELGDLVKTVDTDLALKIYIKAKAIPKVVAAFAERREFDKILIYSKQVS
ncbi:hypothetical protein SOVF_211230, partial [Spinacia oleracea]